MRTLIFPFFCFRVPAFCWSATLGVRFLGDATFLGDCFVFLFGLALEPELSVRRRFALVFEPVVVLVESSNSENVGISEVKVKRGG